MLSRSTPPIQTKLTVNQPGDEFEQEADRVADHVMRMTAPTGIQRKCRSCEEEEKEDKLQRKCTECTKEEQKEVQRKATNAGPEAAPPIVHDVLLSPGHPLDSATRAFMEPRFGHDFSRLRLHTDARAADSAKAVNALAYTVGSDIVFGRQQYAPASPDGQRLVAYELTHVVQQCAAVPIPPGAQLVPAASCAVPASSTGGAKSISATPGGALQHQAPGAETLTSLGGQALSTNWSRLSPAIKAQLIDFVIDAQIEAIPSFPGKEIFGDTWIFLKEGLTGFLTKLKASPTAIKVQAMDNIYPTDGDRPKVQHGLSQGLAQRILH